MQMAQSTSSTVPGSYGQQLRTSASTHSTPAYQADRILHVAFVGAPAIVRMSPIPGHLLALGRLSEEFSFWDGERSST